MNIGDSESYSLSYTFAETNKIYAIIKAAIAEVFYMCKKHERGLASANCALNRGEVDGEILSSRK